MKDTEKIHASGRSGSSTVARIKIGTEIVSSDNPVACTLNVQDPLGGNPVVYPFGDRLWRDTESTSESSLRSECLESGGQKISVHEGSVIPPQFMHVKRQVMDANLTVDEHRGMQQRIPQPENYATFAAWVRALVQGAPSQAALARAVGVKPQMLTKYLAGKSIEPENLQKFADYAAVSYAKLRLLVDGKSLSDAKNIKDRVNQTSTPMGAQIGRQWEQIQDERQRANVAEQIRMYLELQTKIDAATRKKVS